MICPPEHKHGQTATCFTLHHCRCPDCTESMRAYRRRRDELRREGRWAPLHDAGPARERIDLLRSWGMSLSDIAHSSGVTATTVEAIADGTRKRTSRKTLDALTAARALPLRERGKVPTLHAARRIEALVAIGWPLTWIGDEIGHTRTTLRVILDGRWPTVDGWMFRKIDDFYREHAMRPPVPRDRYERTVVTLARNTAVRNGWRPAVAWDDIDDPAEVPEGVAA